MLEGCVRQSQSQLILVSSMFAATAARALTRVSASGASFSAVAQRTISATGPRVVANAAGRTVSFAWLPAARPLHTAARASLLPAAAGRGFRGLRQPFRVENARALVARRLLSAGPPSAWRKNGPNRLFPAI